MTRRILIPLAIVAGGFGLAALLIVTGPKIEPRPARMVALLTLIVDWLP